MPYVLALGHTYIYLPTLSSFLHYIHTLDIAVYYNSYDAAHASFLYDDATHLLYMDMVYLLCLMHLSKT